MSPKCMQRLLTGLMLCAVRINAPVIEDRHKIYDCRCHGRMGLAEGCKENTSPVAYCQATPDALAWEEDQQKECPTPHVTLQQGQRSLIKACMSCQNVVRSTPASCSYSKDFKCCNKLWICFERRRKPPFKRFMGIWIQAQAYYLFIMDSKITGERIKHVKDLFIQHKEPENA